MEKEKNLPLYTEIKGMFPLYIFQQWGIEKQEKEIPAGITFMDEKEVELYRAHGTPLEHTLFSTRENIRENKGYLDEQSCFLLKCEVEEEEYPIIIKPIRFFDGQYGQYCLYDRTRDPRWRLKLLTDSHFDPKNVLYERKW